SCTGESTENTMRWRSEAPLPPSTWWLITTRWRRTRPTRMKPILRASMVSPAMAAPSVQTDLPQEVEAGEHITRTHDHAGEGILGHGNGQPRLLAQELVQVLEQAPPSGEDDPPIHDVGGELGGRALEGHSHRVHDQADGLGQGLPDLGVGDGQGLGDALDEVAALDLHGH